MKQKKPYTIVDKETVKTNRDYTTQFMGYGEITVPAGTLVTNQTACGIDKNYNFVNSFEWVKTNYPEIAGILLHDLKYHGLNVPIEYVNVKNTYSAICPQTGEHYTFRAYSNEDARHWVINHLDTSKEWTVKNISAFPNEKQ